MMPQPLSSAHSFPVFAYHIQNQGAHANLFCRSQPNCATRSSAPRPGASGAQDPLLGELLRSRNERLRTLGQNVISSGFHWEMRNGELTHDVSISIPREARLRLEPHVTYPSMSPNFSRRLVSFVYIICDLHNFS